MSALLIPMKNKILNLGVATLLLAANSLMAEWEKLPPLPEPVGGFACGADNGGITVLGGTNWKNGEKQWLQSISHFDPKTKRWAVIGKLTEPVSYGVCGIRRSSDGREQFIVLGGSAGKVQVKALTIVDTVKTVLQPAPSLPEKLVLCAGGVIGDAFIMAGGTDDAANVAGFTSRAFAFDLTKRSITALPDYPGKPFGIAASAVAGGEILVFGGANWDQATKAVTNTAESYSFSLENKKWRKLKPYPLAVRAPTAVALDEHRVYIAGGYGGEPGAFLSVAYTYDTRTDAYTKATPLPYAATLGLVVLDGFVYCLGGEDMMKHRTDEVWRVSVEELLK
jgi:N-acetylneuraminic acid mutarotase